MIMCKCRRCKQKKDISQFGMAGMFHVRRVCRDCTNDRRRNNYEGVLRQKLAQFHRSGGSRWVTIDDLHETFTEVCQACGEQCTTCSIQLDHDHKTHLFRGWLCGPCNRALGHVGDSPERLQLLIKYLKGRCARPG
jgi:hypothetical protein